MTATAVGLATAVVGPAQAQTQAAARGAPELAGKCAIVSGASRNMGRAFSQALARMGADVVVHHHTEASRADAEITAGLVRQAGRRAVLTSGDLSQAANVKAMYDAAEQHFGRVDVVVNNAGAIRKKPISALSEQEIDMLLGINARGLLLSMQESARRLADNGRVISIGSSLIGATTGLYAGYAGTKAPVEQFSRALAREVGERGITVNVIAPGPVDTPFYHREENAQSTAYATNLAVKKRLGHIDDIVPLVEFLASPRSHWVTAQTIFINGGYYMR